MRTLAEILGDAGYATSCIGFSANPASRGFQTYLDFTAMLFVGILVLGLAYAWVRGDLEWVRPNPTVPTLEPKEIKARRQRENITAPEAEIKS